MESLASCLGSLSVLRWQLLPDRIEDWILQQSVFFSARMNPEQKAVSSKSNKNRQLRVF